MTIDDVLQMKGYQKLASRFNGYTSPHFHDWTKTPNSILGYVLFKAIQHFFITTFIIFLIFCYGLYLFYIFWKKMYHETILHKKNDEIILCDDGAVNFTEKLKFLKDIFVTNHQNNKQQHQYQNDLELEEHKSLLSNDRIDEEL